MTREEALEKLRAVVAKHEVYIGDRSVEASLDGYIALGLIKLEEPERSSPEALICDILYQQGLRGLAQRAVLDAITSAGLQVVHRSPQEGARYPEGPNVDRTAYGGEPDDLVGGGKES